MSEWLRDCGPAGLALLGGATLVLGALLYVTLARRAKSGAGTDRILLAAMIAGLGLVCAGAEAGRFDGLPHVTSKFDATFFAWLQAVMLRAVAGIVTLALAVPLGHAAARWADTKQRLTPGLLVLAAPGLGLLASSVRLQLAARELLRGTLEPDARLALLRDAVHDSERLLALGVVLGLVGSVGLAFVWLRRPA
jgi:hypothetical protein